MRYSLSVFVALNLLAAVFVPSRLNAQAVGSIVGQVADPGQAIVPGATVTAVEKALTSPVPSLLPAPGTTRFHGYRWEPTR